MGTETVSLAEAAGRVLAEEIAADRDYPPFARSARDGFAVRAADVPGELTVIGEVRAGEVFRGSLSSKGAVEIMTGAPLPEGADAVAMVEHTERVGDRVKIAHSLKSGENFNAQGVEARQGATILSAGRRLGFSEIALLAMVGRECATVYKRPRVAILPTGDEIVETGQQPEAFQIRNSNAWSMAVQVARAGGDPRILAIARDNYDSTRERIEQGLTHDLLLLSGGVSAGKYDIVERVLADLARSSSSTGCWCNRGSRWSSEPPGVTSSSDYRGIRHPPWLRSKYLRERRWNSWVGLRKFRFACCKPGCLKNCGKRPD